MSLQLREKLITGGLGGVKLYLSKKLGEVSTRFTKRTLKQYNDPVIKIATGVAVDFIPMVRESAYLADLGDLIFSDGVRDAITVFVDKPRDCWAEDNTTIHCINFTQLPAAAQVYVDGTAASGATISGSAADFTVKLATALSAGEHDLVILEGNNRGAFSGKIYV